MTGKEKFLREQKLRWFRHAKKMNEERAPVNVKYFVLESRKDRPKKGWKEVQEKDMLARGLKRTDAQDRSLSRFGCKKKFTPACRNTSRVS